MEFARANPGLGAIAVLSVPPGETYPLAATLAGAAAWGSVVGRTRPLTGAATGAAALVTVLGQRSPASATLLGSAEFAAESGASPRPPQT